MPVLSVGLVRGDPGGGQTRTEAPADDVPGQFTLGRKRPLIRDFRRPAAVAVGHPGFGQVELAVHQGPARAGGVGGEHPDLTVVDLPRRAGVLPAHPGRRGALLDESGVVDDQNAIGAETFADVGTDVVAQGVGVPDAAVQQPLKAVRSAVACPLRELPAVLPRRLAQQTADVVPHPPPQIRPTEPARHPSEH